ncbi:hypothetical protein BRARA_C03141 [Brassica rapa]|uniref:Dual specificity phosphatase catalytic domain-containing protein n=1 Tax=Brassica campestris TaxID=3711 RepID=A0A398A033_BRACM|nr:hypothetical protein BRARA_C03141 [Brassica rapa]
MRKHGMGFSKAMELVKSQLPQASPNFGFISQLQQFEKSIKIHDEDPADKKIVA